jgi:hypothetical protein
MVGRNLFLFSFVAVLAGHLKMSFIFKNYWKSLAQGKHIQHYTKTNKEKFIK